MSNSIKDALKRLCLKVTGKKASKESINGVIDEITDGYTGGGSAITPNVGYRADYTRVYSVEINKNKYKIPYEVTHFITLKKGTLTTNGDYEIRFLLPSKVITYWITTNRQQTLINMLPVNIWFPCDGVIFASMDLRRVLWFKYDGYNKRFVVRYTDSTAGFVDVNISLGEYNIDDYVFPEPEYN